MSVQSYFVRYATYPYIFEMSESSSVSGLTKVEASEKGAALQILHKNIQSFGTPFRAVYSAQHGRHLGLFDRLKRFHDR